MIGKELWRNLGLAMACVALITLLLLADFVICFMVLICIVLTLVDLVGFLHFWDITIDTLSCVNIVLAVGLCVDYSAHIAHAFIVSQGAYHYSSQKEVRHQIRVDNSHQTGFNVISYFFLKHGSIISFRDED